VRAAVDERSESVGKKIRDAELAKAPFMLVVGDKEKESGKLAIRSHDDGDVGEMTAAELAQRVGGAE
jgi:threonyl-tRNA synthetase